MPLMTKLALALLALAALTLPSCGPYPVRANKAWHGSTPISATYQFGRLTADLPPGTQVEVVSIAAKQALERQGHAIEAADITPQHGRVAALAPSALGYDRVVVSTTFQGQGAVVRVDVSPQNEHRARLVFETILSALSM